MWPQCSRQAQGEQRWGGDSEAGSISKRAELFTECCTHLPTEPKPFSLLLGNGESSTAIQMAECQEPHSGSLGYVITSLDLTLLGKVLPGSPEHREKEK